MTAIVSFFKQADLFFKNDVKQFFEQEVPAFFKIEDESTQVGQVNNKKVKTNPFVSIPNEMITEILTQLPRIDAVRLSTVCKQWNKAAREMKFPLKIYGSVFQKIKNTPHCEKHEHVNEDLSQTAPTTTILYRCTIDQKTSSQIIYSQLTPTADSNSEDVNSNNIAIDFVISQTKHYKRAYTISLQGFESFDLYKAIPVVLKIKFENAKLSIHTRSAIEEAVNVVNHRNAKQRRAERMQ